MSIDSSIISHQIKCNHYRNRKRMTWMKLHRKEKKINILIND